MVMASGQAICSLVYCLKRLDVSFAFILRLGFEAILPVFPALSPDGQPAIVRRGMR